MELPFLSAFEFTSHCFIWFSCTVSQGVIWSIPLFLNERILYGFPPPPGNPPVKDRFALLHPQTACPWDNGSTISRLLGLSSGLQYALFLHSVCLCLLSFYFQWAHLKSSPQYVIILQMISLHDTKSCLSHSVATLEWIHRAGPAGFKRHKEDRLNGQTSSVGLFWVKLHYIWSLISHTLVPVKVRIKSI